MLLYLIRRILMLVPILILMSMVAFFLIQLPPGDYVTFRIEQLRMSGVEVSVDEAQRLRMQFGLDKPPIERYLWWISGILFRGNWGWSLQWNKSVNEILQERIPMTGARSSSCAEPARRRPRGRPGARSTSGTRTSSSWRFAPCSSSP